MNNFKIVTMCAFLVVAGNLLAAPDYSLRSVAAAKKLSDQAMRDAVTGNYRKAFNRFRAYWPLKKKEIRNAIAGIEKGMARIQKRFGRPLGFVFIGKKTTRDFLVQFTYAEKYQNALVRWTFIYYKPKKRWHVLSVRFDNNYEALLK